MATKTFKIGLSNQDKQNMAQDVYERVLALTFAEYDSAETYNEGDFVVYNDLLYKCLEDNVTGTWDATKWQQATLQDVVDDVEDAVASVANKANVDGNYQTMTVGLANNLNTKIVQNEVEAYLFRTTGGSLEVGNNCKEKGIVGGSLGFNQLVSNGNFINSGAWNAVDGSFTVSNNIATFIASAKSGFLAHWNIPAKADHKIFFSIDVKTETPTTNVVVTVRGYDIPLQATTNWQQISSIGISYPSVNGIYFSITDNRNSDWDDIQVKNVMVIDLTAMFGSTIADYIYSLEQGQAGAGVAWFRRYFNKPYYAYTPIGAFINVKTSGKKVVGFNQCDEEYEGYGINTATGVNDSTTNAFRTENSFEVDNNTAYCVHFNSDLGVESWSFYEYDIIGNFIKATSKTQNNQVITTGEDTYYVRLAFWKSNSGWHTNIPSKDDAQVCLNFHYDGERDGEYEPYESETYANDNIEIIGIPHIDAQGNLYYEGNIYRPDGTIDEEWKMITPTSLISNYQGLLGDTVGVIANDAVGTPDSHFESFNPNIFATRGAVITWGDKQFSGSWEGGDISISYGSNNRVAICVKGVTSAADLITWLTNNPISIIYKKATPTQSSATPYPENQPCDNWGTEKRIDNREVPIPVGHDTDYPLDLKSKLEILPSLPSDDGIYVCKVESGTGEYVPLNVWLTANDYKKAKDLPTIEGIGGALRQVLCLKETLDLDDTGYVDLGELTWTYSTLDGNAAFTSTISGGKTTSKTISTRYEYQDGYQNTNKTYTLQRGEPGTIWVIDNSYTDAVAFKAAVQGVIVAFEKASE